MSEAFKQHWPEYLIEAWGLGAFMVSACFFGVLFFHPDSPLTAVNAGAHNLLMGLAMGLTAVGIILSPWGKRSGAHLNPAFTFTFFRLGKVEFRDAAFYALFQFIGGTLGVILSWLVLGSLLENAAVNFVVTVPGGGGSLVAFIAEFVIAFLLMTMVLVTTNMEKLMRLTPFLAGILITLFITFENPFSGMSMNPARTFASAIVGGVWTDWWIYFLAPPLAMLAAAEVYVRLNGLQKVRCAKYHHQNKQRCIFCGKPDERFIE